MTTHNSEQRSVLVVIPTLNEAGTIRHVLDSLTQGLPAHHQVTFVVSDGGSNDGTPEIVKALAATRGDLRLIHNAKRIQSAAVNLAASTLGRGMDVLIRCDAHAVYPHGFIAQLVASLDSSGADAVVVPMDSIGVGCMQKAVAWVSDTPLGSGGSAHRGGTQSGYVDHGHHAAFKMESFCKAGGYDETFTHNEDAELDCRQGALGARIYLDATIRLGYYPRDTLKGLWKQYFHYGRGRSRTVRRHPGSMRLRQLAVPVHLLLSLIALTVGWLWPVLLAWPALYMSALVGVSLLLAVRHQSLCGLAAGAAAAVMHTSWACGFFWGLLTVREGAWAPSANHPLVPEWPAGGGQ